MSSLTGFKMLCLGIILTAFGIGGLGAPLATIGIIITLAGD